jgi:hypothetical protein
LGRKCHDAFPFGEKLPLHKFLCKAVLVYFPTIERTVIRLPEKREKRHPVTRKLGKTSSGYPKSGKNVIQLPENWEKRHPVDLCQYV